MPDTTTARKKDPSYLGPVLAAVGTLVVLLVAVVSFWPAGFSPGEELISPSAEDIAVNTEDTAYPDSDTLRFEGRPEVVYVYLRVEDLGDDGDLGARAERSTRTSVVGRLLSGGGLRIVDQNQEPLGVSGGGVSGVLKFAVLPRSGERLPAGNYTVEVYSGTGGAGRGGVLARKYFAVGD